MRFRLPRLRAVRPSCPRCADSATRPKADGRPDPGEVVWAWVPYEEDPAQGKDRPVLVIGEEDGDSCSRSALTSRTTTSTRRRSTAPVASGWTSARAPGTASGRPSEVRLNRLLRLDPDGVRREGAALPQDMFDAVLEAAQPYL